MLKLVAVIVLVVVLSSLSVDAKKSTSRRHHKLHRGLKLLAGGGGGGSDQQLVGGHSPLPITAENVDKLNMIAQVALDTYTAPKNANQECNKNLKVVNVTSAQSQVVAGLNYFLDFTVRPSDGKTCNFDPSVEHKCTGEVFVSLSNEMKASNINCEPAIDFSFPNKTPVQTTGGFTKVETTSESVKAMAQLALAAYNDAKKPDDACNQNLLVAAVTSAELQVVNGQNYAIEFRVKPSVAGCIGSNQHTCRAQVQVSIDKKDIKIASILCTPQINFAKPIYSNPNRYASWSANRYGRRY